MKSSPNVTWLVSILCIILLAIFLPACGGGGSNGDDGGGNQRDSSPVLQSISISPKSIQLDYGSTLQLEVIGMYSDGSIKDVTTAVRWEIDNEWFIEIDKNGVLSSKFLHSSKIEDQTEVTAHYEGLIASLTVTVSAVLTSIEIYPSKQYLPPLWYGNYLASAHYNNGAIQDVTDSAEWLVDDSSLATIGNENDSKGIVFTSQQGDTTVTASYASYSDTADLIVMPVHTLDGEGDMFEPPNLFMSSPGVDINEQGEIFIAWKFQTSGEILISGYRPNEGWLANEEINKDSVEKWVYGLNIDINDNGDKLIVWTGIEGIYAAYCESGGNFGEPVKLDATNRVYSSPAALDSDGNALVAWVDVVEDTDYHVMSSHYDHKLVQWSPPEYIGSCGLSAGNMAFASNGRGDALLLWALWDHAGDGKWKLFASRYVASSDQNAGWQNPVQLDVSDVYYSKSVAINESGEIIAVWCSASEDVIYFSKFTPGVGWSNKDIVPKGTVYAPWDLQVSVNESGNAVVVYRDHVQNTIDANRYDSVTGWSECENLRDPNAGDPTVLTPYIDEQGNIMALWKPESYSSLGGVETRRYLTSEGWQDIEGVCYVAKLGNVYHLHNAFNSRGEGIIGWREILPIGYGTYNFASNDLTF